jgi:hypothetical protein
MPMLVQVPKQYGVRRMLALAQFHRTAPGGD